MEIGQLVHSNEIHQVKTEHEILVDGFVLLALIETVNVRNCFFECRHITSNHIVHCVDLEIVLCNKIDKLI